MQSLVRVVCLLSGVASVLAGPVGRNVKAQDYEKRQTSAAFTPEAYCSTYSDANALISASKSFDYKDFCYYYMQPTYDHFIIVSSSVSSTTLTSTYNTYTTTTTTSTNFATSTSTALCPASTPSSITCDLPAAGLANNQISSDWDPTDGYTCQQSCLANPLCKSFQTVPENNGAMQWQICNLYNGTVNETAYPMTGNGVMWDRDCPDFLPAGCSASIPTPTLTTSTPAPTIAAALARNAGLEPLDAALAPRQNTIPYPSFLGIGQEDMYYACLCITTAAPTITQTVTLIVPVYSEVTISETHVQINTVTSAPNVKTTVSSVAG